MVDITITQAHVEWVAAKAMRPGLISWTNNAMDWSHMASYLAERVEGTQQAFMNWGVGHKLITTIWGTPAAMIMCAGGFAFEGAKAWLNQRVFCVDTDQVVDSMSKLYKKEKFYAGTPGQTFHMKLVGRFSFDIFPKLHRMSYPLRQPSAYLKTYERLYAAARETTPVYKHRS